MLNDHVQHYAKLNNFFLKGEFTMQILVKEKIQKLRLFTSIN